MLQFLCNPGQKSLVGLESLCVWVLLQDVFFYIFFSKRESANLASYVFPWFRPLASQISDCKVTTEIWRLGLPPPALFLSKLMIALTLQAFPLLATNLPSDTVWIVWLFCFQQVCWWRTAPEEYYSHCPTAYQNNFIPLLCWDVSCVDKKSLFNEKRITLWVLLLMFPCPKHSCWRSPQASLCESFLVHHQ